MRKFLLLLLALLCLSGCFAKRHDFGPPGTPLFNQRPYTQIIERDQFNYCFVDGFYSVAVETGLPCPTQEVVAAAAAMASSLHGRELSDLNFPEIIFTHGSFKCGDTSAIGCTIVGGKNDNIILVSMDDRWRWTLQHEFFHQWLREDKVYVYGDTLHAHPSWKWAY